ncbi:MAG: hypothetical protein AB7V42_00065 [Thermoleophilia bacterium]
MRALRPALALLLAGLLLGVLAATAGASRSPTTAEREAIRARALNVCDRTGAPSPCRYHRARVSTRNARFAWADVTNEGFSAVLLRRPSVGSLAFRVVGVQGGGINTCAYWRARAGRKVLRDLRVSGLLNVRTGRVGLCG